MTAYKQLPEFMKFYLFNQTDEQIHKWFTVLYFISVPDCIRSKQFPHVFMIYQSRVGNIEIDVYVCDSLASKRKTVTCWADYGLLSNEKLHLNTGWWNCAEKNEDQ